MLWGVYIYIYIYVCVCVKKDSARKGRVDVKS
jgi:hypothetical protein